MTKLKNIYFKTELRRQDVHKMSMFAFEWEKDSICGKNYNMSQH